MALSSRGWRRGLDAGVFEVQSHGWTHRNPQWEKYWAAGPTKRLDNRWGGEFYDRLGHTEVPNAMKLFSLKRSRAVLEEIWGQRPLYFVSGQHAESYSYANHTARLARKAGFAITQDFHRQGREDQQCPGARRRAPDPHPLARHRRLPGSRLHAETPR